MQLISLDSFVEGL